MKRIKVSESGIHGKGLVALEDIAKGETIRYLNGAIHVKKNTTKKEAEEGPNWIVIDKALSVDPDSYFEFVNHSCDPSASITDFVKCVAIRDIKKGEEVTIDYATVEDNRFWSMPCSCGASNCREIIRSVQHLPQSAFERYKNYLTSYFKNKYISHQNYIRRKERSKIVK